MIYTEEDGEDDEMTKKLLTTIKALFSASRTDVRSLHNVGRSTVRASEMSVWQDDDGAELVMAYEETTDRACVPPPPPPPRPLMPGLCAAGSCR